MKLIPTPYLRALAEAYLLAPEHEEDAIMDVLRSACESENLKLYPLVSQVNEDRMAADKATLHPAYPISCGNPDCCDGPAGSDVEGQAAEICHVCNEAFDERTRCSCEVVDS